MLGMKGAAEETDKWKIRVQLTKPVTWVPLIWGESGFRVCQCHAFRGQGLGLHGAVVCRLADLSHSATLPGVPCPTMVAWMFIIHATRQLFGQNSQCCKSVN